MECAKIRMTGLKPEIVEFGFKKSTLNDYDPWYEIKTEYRGACEHRK